MASRALIIAIEEYPNSDSGMMEKKLPGVIDSASKFRDWLEDKWATENEQNPQLIFCSEPQQPNGQGASWQEIISALEQLEQDGLQSSTDELFVYFSGHGFRFERSVGTLSDVLVASDFVDRGNLCLKLDEVVNWLRAHLGPGKHYYFIDACRNVLDRSQIQVGDALRWQPKISGEASCYVLQSTVSGSPALVAGPFAESLLGGLQGESRAKIWAENPHDGMLVRYDSLRTYLKKQLSDDQPITSRVDGEDGETDAIFTKLSPPPSSTLRVELQNVDPGQEASLVLTRIRNQSTQTQVIRSDFSLQVEPDNYLLEITSQDATFQPSGEQEVDLFEAEQQLIFEAEPLGLEMAATAEAPILESSINLVIPDQTQLELRGIGHDADFTIMAPENIVLPHGRYETTLRSSSGTTLKKGIFELNKETSQNFDPIGVSQSPIHEEVLRQLPSSGISPYFSESLGGSMDDPDINLWLTILGGGKIIGSDHRFSKINQFKLHDFSNLQPDSTALYVIAGHDTQLRAALGPGPDVTWLLGSSPEDLPSVREVYFDGTAGPNFISLQLDDLEPVTVATCLLPNRVTLIVLTTGEDNEPVVNQFILPVGHLVPHMDPHIQDILTGRNHLHDLKFLAQISRAFRKRQKLEDEFSGPELSDLLHSKWLDPIGASLAAYELARRGDTQNLTIVADNLLRFFPQFPDGAAIAHLAGQNIPPNGIPLFLEGWLPLSHHPDAPVSPSGNLNHRSPFTTWLSAVTS